MGYNNRTARLIPHLFICSERVQNLLTLTSTDAVLKAKNATLSAANSRKDRQDRRKRKRRRYFDKAEPVSEPEPEAPDGPDDDNWGTDWLAYE